MKSLDKERNRRYETAAGLARDIERYLHDESVQACPPSARYQFHKFARRNKALLASGGAIAAALFIGLGLSTWMYFRATTESARAKAVSNLLQEMLGSADAASTKGANYKVRELLDDFSASLGRQLTNEPEVEADIHATIGRAYRSLRLPDKARPHFEKAIELRRRIDGPHGEKLAAILVDCAWNLHDGQKYSDADSQLQEALEIYRQRGETGGPLFHALEILQHVLISSGRDDEAERVTQQALAVASHAGEELPDQANLLHRYADLKIRQGHFAEAEQRARQAVDMHRRLHGERHPETGWALKTLARALVRLQKLAEAEAALHESLAIFRRQFPEDHPNIRDTMGDLRAVLQARDDKVALEALKKEEAEIAMRSGTPDYHLQLGEILTRQSMPAFSPEDAQRLATDGATRTEVARRHIRQAIEAYARLPIDYPDNLDRRLEAILGCIKVLKVCLAAPGFAGEVDELNARLKAELPKLVADSPESSQYQWEIAMCYNSWGRVLLNPLPGIRSGAKPPDSDYLPTAEHAFSKSSEILEKLSKSIPQRPYLWVWLASSYVGLGEIRWRSGRTVDAEAPFRTAIRIYDEHAAKIAADIAAEPFAGINSEIIRTYIGYAFYLAATRREKEASDFVGKAALDAKHLTDPVETVNTLYLLALAQVRLGDEPGYRATCQALVDVPLTSADDLTKQGAIWTCCLAPAALEDLTLPVKRAEEFVAINRLNQRHFALQTLGAALYRAGRYEEAAERLKESLAAYRGEIPRGYDTINYTRLLLAMTKWQQGKHDEARRLLSETLPAVDVEIQNPSTYRHRRATLQVLRREAEALIGKIPSDGAKQQEIQIDNPSKP
jgi:tetratricopeptide (TPR) repeat protein